MKYLFMLTVLIFLISCKKEVGEPKDTELPKITITSPVANQVFSGGQTIAINATITDNKNIKEVHLEIVNNTTGTLITHEHFVPGAATYKLDRTFAVQAATSYKIRVEADDDNDNEAKIEMNISAN